MTVQPLTSRVSPSPPSDAVRWRPSMATTSSRGRSVRPSQTAPPRRTSLPMGRDSTQTWQDGRVEPWFDTHVHLGHFDAARRKAILQRAAESEVAVIDVAVDLESSAGVVSRVGTSPHIPGAVVGVHPKYADRWAAEQIRELARQPGIVGVGECGFDASGPGWAAQEATFQA